MRVSTIMLSNAILVHPKDPFHLLRFCFVCQQVLRIIFGIQRQMKKKICGHHQDMNSSEELA